MLATSCESIVTCLPSVFVVAVVAITVDLVGNSAFSASSRFFSLAYQAFLIFTFFCLERVITLKHPDYLCAAFLDDFYLARYLAAGLNGIQRGYQECR